MNFKELTPGTLLQTPQGPGIFQQFKPGNFRNQTVQVKIHNRLVWFRENEIEKK